MKIYEARNISNKAAILVTTIGTCVYIVHFRDNNNNMQPFLMFCKSLFFSKYNVVFIDINISPNEYVYFICYAIL